MLGPWACMAVPTHRVSSPSDPCLVREAHTHTHTHPATRVSCVRPAVAAGGAGGLARVGEDDVHEGSARRDDGESVNDHHRVHALSGRLPPVQGVRDSSVQGEAGSEARTTSAGWGGACSRRTTMTTSGMPMEMTPTMAVHVSSWSDWICMAASMMPVPPHSQHDACTEAPTVGRDAHLRRCPSRPAGRCYRPCHPPQPAHTRTFSTDVLAAAAAPRHYAPHTHTHTHMHLHSTQAPAHTLREIAEVSCSEMRVPATHALARTPPGFTHAPRMPLLAAYDCSVGQRWSPACEVCVPHDHHGPVAPRPERCVPQVGIDPATHAQGSEPTGTAGTQSEKAVRVATATATVTGTDTQAPGGGYRGVPTNWYRRHSSRPE